jgi:hypothetical protein
VSPDQKWRGRARKALENYFSRRSYPKAILTLLLMLTGLVGFFVSYALLRAGVDHMWVRYPIAVVIGYCALLGFVRLWVEFERGRFDPDDPVLKEPVEEERELNLKTVSDSGSWWEFPDFLDFGDEGFVPLVLVLALITLVVALLVTIFTAPLLIAEVFLNAFLVSVLYRRLRIAQEEHWLGAAIRRTWFPALLAALALSASGWALEQLAPGSRSAGKAIQQMLRGDAKQELPLER